MLCYSILFYTIPKHLSTKVWKFCAFIKLLTRLDFRGELYGKIRPERKNVAAVFLGTGIPIAVHLW